MTAAVRAEWTKLRTQRGAIVALLATALLMIGCTALGASQSQTDAQLAGGDDVVQLGLSGILFAQLAVAVAGASLMTGEWSSRMIRTTLTATQSRFRVLAAKATVLTIATLPLALASSIVSFVLAQSLLHDRGYIAPAYPPVSLTDAPALRAVAGTAILLTLYGLLALGLGTVIRHSGATIATCVGLLFFPFFAIGLLPEHLATRVEQLAPLAGLSIQDTTGRMLMALGGQSQVERVEVTRDGATIIHAAPLPIGHWQGLAVTGAWALGALALGCLALRARDA